MKKLMVAAAIVCAAMGAKAVFWPISIKVENVKDSKGDPYSGSAVLYLQYEIGSGTMEFELSGGKKEMASITNIKDTSDQATYTGYFMFTDEYNKTYTSATVSGNVSPTLYFAYDANVKSGTWTGDVPEPTSGLLMLMGGMLLGLRRKRV